jgi:hypothetical protein
MCGSQSLICKDIARNTPALPAYLRLLVVNRKFHRHGANTGLACLITVRITAKIATLCTIRQPTLACCLQTVAHRHARRQLAVRDGFVFRFPITLPPHPA